MGKSKTWREYAKPVIQKVLAENAGADLKTKKKALREAYPFGERKYHPYKIWCDEVKVQTGRKKKKIRGEVNNPNQLNIL